MTTAIQDITGTLTIIANNPAHITQLLHQGLQGPDEDVIIPPNSHGQPLLQQDGTFHLTIPQTHCAEAICSQCNTPICAGCDDTVTVHVNPNPTGTTNVSCGPCQGLPH